MHFVTRLFRASVEWARQHKNVLVGGFCVFAIVSLAVLLPTHFIFAGSHSDVDTSGWGSVAESHFINLIAKVLNNFALVIGKFVLLLIGIILIPILNYDGFATSHIVGLGWSLVRDTVNMFVVVVLLVIAVLTIVSSPKVNWQQQIPRLFIYVVLVNFSRTICGFLIDIGNVIMFQFVNALAEIGAGNFAQLLKLTIIGDYSEGITEAEALGNLGAAFLQVALMTMIAAIVGIICIVFIYRIVVLWVLIIMSPAAFFLGGIKDVFAQAGSAYSQWWKKFSSAIVLGPILTFFLWLALAASAGGDVVTRENFPTGESDNFAGILLKVFDMSQLTGLLLGVVLLVVGLQQAASAAGALGGIAAKLVSEDMGFKIAKAGLRWPATYASGAYKAANYVAPETTAAATAASAKFVGSGISGLGAGISNIPIASSLGAGFLGRKISEQGNKLYNVGEHVDEEQAKKAAESLKHAPEGYRREVLQAMSKRGASGGAFAGMSQWQRDYMYKQLATKDGEQKFAARILDPEDNDRLMSRVIDKTQRDLNDGHSNLEEAERTNFKATKSKHVDLMYDMNVYGETQAERDLHVREFIQSDDFSHKVVRDRALDGSRGAARTSQVRADLNTKEVSRTSDDVPITALHELERSGKSRRVAGSGRAMPGVVGYRRPGTYGIDGEDPRNHRPPSGGAGGGAGGSGAGGPGGGTPGGGGPAGPGPGTPGPGSGGSGSGGGGGAGPAGPSGGGSGGGSSGGGASGGGGGSGAGGGGSSASSGGGSTASTSGSATASATPRSPKKFTVKRPVRGGGGGPTASSSGGTTTSTTTASASGSSSSAPSTPEKPTPVFVEVEEESTPRTVEPLANADAALEDARSGTPIDYSAGTGGWTGGESASNNKGFEDAA